MIGAASILEKYCRLHSLTPPEFQVHQHRENRHVGISYLCTVIFKEKKYQSYPNFFLTPAQAKDNAAGKLLRDLGEHSHFCFDSRRLGGSMAEHDWHPAGAPKPRLKK